MRKHLFKNQFLVSILSIAVLSILLAACSSTPAKPPLNTNGSPTPVLTTLDPAATICPRFGTARAAMMPSLHVGGQPALIYYTGDSQGDSFIKRINVATNVTTNMLGLANANITEAQVSPDGQWLLFVIVINYPHQHIELRALRVDGQYQQTLFCLPATATPYASELGQFVWSPDLASVAVQGFSGPFDLPAIYVVDLKHGQVQLEIASSFSQLQQGPTGSHPLQMELYTPLKWLDNTRLYVGGYTENNNALSQANTYLLGTARGANQTTADLQRILSNTHVFSGPSFCDFDSSRDAAHLYVAQCSYKANVVQKQSSLTVQPATGGPAKTIFSTNSFAIIGVRVINSHTLLLLTDKSIGNGYSGDALWRINTDGTGLTQLASGNALTWCSYLQNNCSNISTGGQLFAYMASGGSSDLIYYGSVADGKPRQVVQLNSLYEAMVGWTTM
jgi:eukaryotic-like serine/threonine-protein kinase